MVILGIRQAAGRLSVISDFMWSYLASGKLPVDMAMDAMHVMYVVRHYLGLTKKELKALPRTPPAGVPISDLDWGNLALTSNRYKQTNKQTNEQTNKQTNKQIDKQTNK